MKPNQKGFSIAEILLAVLIIAVVIFGGYYVYHRHSINNSSHVKTELIKENGTIYIPDSTKTSQVFTLSNSIDTNDALITTYSIQPVAASQEATTVYSALLKAGFYADNYSPYDVSGDNKVSNIYVSILNSPSQYSAEQKSIDSSKTVSSITITIDSFSK